MDLTRLRPALVGFGLLVAVVAVSIATGERPRPGTLVGVAIGTACVFALERLEGPLEKRTARVGAIVLAGVFVAGALWLHA